MRIISAISINLLRSPMHIVLSEKWFTCRHGNVCWWELIGWWRSCMYGNSMITLPTLFLWFARNTCCCPAVDDKAGNDNEINVCVILKPLCERRRNCLVCFRFSISASEYYLVLSDSETRYAVDNNFGIGNLVVFLAVPGL